MRGWPLLVLWSLPGLAAHAFAGPTEVRVTGDRVDVRAATTPLSDVLDALARQTGMKVVYEGPPPRTLVSATIERVTPIEATVRLMEGMGLTYAAITDSGGLKVVTLLVITSAGSRASASIGAPPAPPPPSDAAMVGGAAATSDEDEEPQEDADAAIDTKPERPPVQAPGPGPPAPIIIPGPGIGGPSAPGIAPIMPVGAPPGSEPSKPQTN